MITWIIEVIRDNVKCLNVSLSMAKKELKRAHSKSDLGWFWAIAKPLMYIFMFYFAISTGFRNAKEIEGSVAPYFIWLASGIVPWQFISDLLVGGATCFVRHKSIIKHFKYPYTAIPTIPILPKLFIHFIMVGVLVIMALLMGVRPSIYWLQLPIYTLLAFVFIYVWVCMTGLLNVMSADLVEFIKTIRTAFFWLSGILFNTRGKKGAFFAYNPIRYIAEGYRNVFAYHVWIWEQKRLLFNFGIVMILMTAFTCLLYRRLEKRLPELL
ncbi:MAG: ABC transporter permease [Mogibacterium sp.]|nr:ABC transporter permease [Mogibacterium sp.]MBQ6501020.1 ABC transporter permease [Mogibacterium sp.]